MTDDTEVTRTPVTSGAGEARNEGVVVRNTFALVRALGRAQRPVGVTALAAEAGIPKTTAHRLLEQMADEDVVVRRDHKWALGPGLGELTQAPYRPDLAGVAHPRMHVLTRATGATLFLYTQSRGRALDALCRSYGPRVTRVMTESEQRLVAERPSSAIWRALDGGEPAVEYQEAHPACDCIAAPLVLPSGETAVLALAQPSDANIDSLRRPLDRIVSQIISDMRRLDS